MLKRAIIALSLTAAAAASVGAPSAQGQSSYARIDARSGAPSADTTATSRGYWIRFGTGFATSILIHEAGHLGAAIASGAKPTFGFDRARPTIYSGIDADRYPRRQFWFSSAGLNVQALLDEAILDIPHRRGSAFERGILGGGIGTALFYLTLGRTGSVSDVDFMSHTGVLTKTQVTLIYGSVALAHGLRIAHDPAYANFFARPSRHGFDAGMRWPL